MLNETPDFVYKAYSIAELARFYGVCHLTIKKWIKPFLAEIGEKQGRFYTVLQVRIITEKIGLP